MVKSLEQQFNIEEMSTTSDIEPLKWADIEAQFQQLHPQLHALFDEAFKQSAAYFYRVRYSFGMDVIQDGQVIVPGNIPGHPPEHTTPLPLAFITQGVLEADIHLPSHLIPLAILKPGSFLNVGSLFQHQAYSHHVRNAHTYTAGSRSLVILPKISHEQYNERLIRAFAINPAALCPKTFLDQWLLFKELANSPKFTGNWQAEVLFFSPEAMQLILNNPAIQCALLQMEHQNNDFQNNQLMYDLVWSIFSEKLSNSIKNGPFIVETVKHLIKLAMGAIPGYIPAASSLQAPMPELIDIFLNVYRIRYYLPVFMELDYFNRQDPLYYSLQKHTFLCNIPQKNNANRTIDELTAIKDLIASFTEQVLDNKLPISLENTLLYKTLQEVEFDFFHPQGGEALNTDVDSLIAEDPRFMTLTNNLTLDKSVVFPKHSLFFNGCVRIRPRRKEPKVSMKNFLSSVGPFRLDDDK